MILGNSKGQNTGKKYLMRKNIQNITPNESQTNKCRDFNNWYVNNHDRMRLQFIDKGYYNETVFIDTYIRICESLMFGNITIKSYVSYFSRAYYTNYILAVKNTPHFEDLPYDLNTENDLEDIDSLRMKKGLLQDILSFVKASFSETDYRLFLMNVINGKTQTECAEYFNKPKHKIQSRLSEIRKDIRQIFGKRRISQSYKCTLSDKI